MLYESLKDIASRPAARQHLRQHEENLKDRSKKSSEWWVFVEILKIFQKLPDDLIYCFIMFFDALEVQEHVQSDSRSIWDDLFFHHF